MLSRRHNAHRFPISGSAGPLRGYASPAAEAEGGAEDTHLQRHRSTGTVGGSGGEKVAGSQGLASETTAKGRTGAADEASSGDDREGRLPVAVTLLPTSKLGSSMHPEVVGRMCDFSPQLALLTAAAHRFDSMVGAAETRIDVIIALQTHARACLDALLPLQDALRLCVALCSPLCAVPASEESESLLARPQSPPAVVAAMPMAATAAKAAAAAITMHDAEVTIELPAAAGACLPLHYMFVSEESAGQQFGQSGEGSFRQGDGCTSDWLHDFLASTQRWQCGSWFGPRSCAARC